jgi:centromere protein C
VQRSRRVPYPPLDWWRLEKVEYSRDPDSGGDPILCPAIKAIIRIPKEPVIPLGNHGKANKRATSAPRGPVEKIIEKVIEVPVEVSNPEEGWDDETEVDAIVNDFGTNTQVSRRMSPLLYHILPLV